MSKYSWIIAAIGPALLIGSVIFYFLKGYCLYLKIKKDPVYVKAKIVNYIPGSPNNMGKVDIAITYTFTADNKVYTNGKENLTINTRDLNKDHIGKEVPIVYYRKDPNYSKIDVYDESLRN
ncbi:hypothetical protein [Kosakonia sp. CFBP8986]|jgi:hypothetical protein|uniref:hypothetical protein n=1 Tax=unclassified Kosakonia TaxID=2632876 RepID=UPI002A698AF7|nr:hypothetical protein [Kosakonia sp. CFBP8986]MDY0889929.1 hypothetical protein [Kosakonia sp. CFBP8986]